MILYFVAGGRFVELRKNYIKKKTTQDDKEEVILEAKKILCAVFYEVPQ